MDVTVGIITHPPRVVNGMLDRAVDSVLAQTRPPESLKIRVDTRRDGAPIMRQRLLDSVTTKWLAWLDSDDEFLPDHLETLMTAAEEQNADYVFSAYMVSGGTDPFVRENGRPWDPERPRQTTTTILVKTDLAKSIGYSLGIDPTGGGGTGEDWAFTVGAVARGAKIVCVPTITWIWHHRTDNTSGRPDRW